jgi:hypothetical protein
MWDNELPQSLADRRLPSESHHEPQALDRHVVPHSHVLFGQTPPFMTAERKFSDAEVSRILEQASIDDAPLAPRQQPGEGLSLAQITEIAAEVGIDRQRIERAAQAVVRGEAVAAKRRTWLGLPIGVSRTVALGRTLNEGEWDQLVVLFRETFDARGRLQGQGAFRQWTNGNLQALLEPTPEGHRLRLSTRKGDAKLRLAMGLGGLLIGVAIVLGVVSAPSGQQDLGALLAGAALGSAGAITFGATWLGLPAWARRRAEQMEEIARRVLAPTGGPSDAP